MHILFVDDLVETRHVFQLRLETDGHIVETAQSGQEALRIITRHADSLDVIIMDHHMPGQNGLEVVKELRQIEGLPPIPIILLTADARGGIEAEAEKLGVTRVLYKPMLPTDLATAVQEILAKP